MSLNLAKYGKFSKFIEGDNYCGGSERPNYYYGSHTDKVDGIRYNIIVFRECSFFMGDQFVIRIIYNDAFKKDTFLQGYLSFEPGPIGISDIGNAVKKFFKKNNIQAEFDF